MMCATAAWRLLGLALGLTLLAPSLVWGHGAFGALEGRGGLIIASSYDDGTGMSFARVTIQSPAGKTFQTGFTDKTGRFAFVPDQTGEWTFVTEDGMGHRVEVKIPVTPEILRGGQLPEGQQKTPVSKIDKALVGISLIFGCLGIFFFWKGRRR